MRGFNPADILEEKLKKELSGETPPTTGLDVVGGPEASTSAEYTDAMIASTPEPAPVSVEEPEQEMEVSEPQAQPEPEQEMEVSEPQVQPEPELSREEKLIKELRRIQDEKTSEAKTAQEEANKRALWANAIQTLGTVGQAQIQRDAGVQTGMSAPKMIQAEDARGRVMSERDMMLKQMMDEYNLLQSAKPKQMSELDRAKIESEKARAEKFRADAQKATKETKYQPSIFEKKKMEQLAKSGVEYFQKDRPQLESNLDKINKAQKILSSGSDAVSGRFVGRLPDFFRTQNSILSRESMQSAIQETLRPTLGAQFTEKEGERIMKLAYNETLEEDKNLEKTKELEKVIRNKIKFSDDLYKYIEEKGSDKGFPYGKYGMRKGLSESKEMAKVGDKEYLVGENVVIKGKTYRIKDANGELEEVK